jgi:hypothetical protein
LILLDDGNGDDPTVGNANGSDPPALGNEVNGSPESMEPNGDNDDDDDGVFIAIANGLSNGDDAFAPPTTTPAVDVAGMDDENADKNANGSEYAADDVGNDGAGVSGSKNTDNESAGGGIEGGNGAATTGDGVVIILDDGDT